MRIVLLAGLMLGVIAMHSFGHASHTEQRGQIVETAHSAHHGHAMDTGSDPAEDDSEGSGLMSVLGLMVCTAIIARFALGRFRSAVWMRLSYRLLAALEQTHRESSRPWLPPPRLRPTGLQINRISVLRI